MSHAKGGFIQHTLPTQHTLLTCVLDL